METQKERFDLCLADRGLAERNVANLAVPAPMICQPAAAVSLEVFSPSLVTFEEAEAARLRREAEEHRRREEQQNTPYPFD